MNPSGESKICVAIRKRPINKKEVANGQEDIVVVQNGQTVIVSEYKQKVDLTKYIEQSAFNFDFAFDQSCNNQNIYLKAVRPLIDSAFQGARVTCFAYGQTGSGKTYTMNGDSRQGVAGLYTLGAHDIFSYKAHKQFAHLKVSMSFFEIYCGKLFDLLKNRAELKIREDDKSNVHIIGLNEEVVNCPQDFMKIMEFGSNQRKTAQNSTNADSSRSHAILQITLKEGKKIRGKISFIDLAGCERGADHMDQNKQTKIDGAEINKSLLALKECIRALDQGKGHTPFRGSKLTMVLKDSFVGFCRTVMIGNISPNSGSCQNTLNTLRYADRVKQLKKGGNQSLTRQEIAAKELMLPRNGKNAVKIMIDKDDDMEDIMNKKLEARQMLGIKDQPPKMMIQEPANRPKNNTFIEKQSIKKIQSQEPRNLNKQPQNNVYSTNKNQPGLFDNCKTVELRPKANQMASPGNKLETSHPYGHKNSLKANEVRGSNPQNDFNYEQNQRQSSYSQSGYNQMNFNQNQNQNQNYNQNPNQNFNSYQNQNQHLFGNNPQYSSQNHQFVNQIPNNQITNNQSWSQQSYQAPQQQYKQVTQAQYDAQKFKNNVQQFLGPPNQNNQQQNNQRNYNQQQDHYQFQSPQPKQVSSGHKQNAFNPNLQDAINDNNNRRYSHKSQTNNFLYQPNNINNNQSPYNRERSRSRSKSQSKSKNNMWQQNDSQGALKPTMEWKKAVDKFKDWNPNCHNPDEVMYFRDVHEILVDKLVEEENNLTSDHSTTINREIETIKAEMKFIQEIEKNKASHQSIQYVEFIEDMIDRKLSALMVLKKKTYAFKQHLIQHQECEQKILMAQQQLAQPDELLLLDDYEEEA